MKRRIIILLIAFISGAPWTTINAQKEFQNLKGFIKTSNYAEGRKLIVKCLGDTLLNSKPQLYQLAIALETKANDAENMKLYLNQKYDTAAFFNTTGKIVEYTCMLDNLERQLSPKNIEAKSKKRQETLSAYYPNLYNGGMYFIKHKQWDAAHKFFSDYIELSRSPLLQAKNPMPMSKFARAAFWSMTACYEAKRYSDVFKYQDIAEADTANLNYVMQYEALAYLQLKDTTNYVLKLKEGIARTASTEFFFSRLTDYYNTVHDYHAAYLLNDSLLATDSTSTLYLYAQTIALFNMKEYDKCIDNTTRLVNIDSDNAEANYYLGICWYNKGIDFDATLVPDPTSKTYKAEKQKVNDMFRNAMPYLEKYRAARPDDKDRWQAPLYRIYFSLNESQKLKELEK